MTWRRVSDWKQTIALVDVRDLPFDGLSTPEMQLRERFPRLASWVAETALARVEPELAERIRAAGGVTYEVGYHRVSDGLLFAEVTRDHRYEEQVDVNALDLGELGEPGELSDEELDSLSSDRVDALLSIVSEGQITERAVILASHAPPLTDTPGPLDQAELSAVEALDPAQLPRATEAFVDRVATAFAVMKPPEMTPLLTRKQRLSYMKKASVIGAIAAVAGIGGMLWVPLLMVLAAPVVGLCAAIIALHAVALKHAA